MKCTILHESNNRIRIHTNYKYFSLKQADQLEYYLNHQDSIVSAKVYDRTGDVVISYLDRDKMIEILSKFKFDENLPTSDFHSRELSQYYEEKIVMQVVKRVGTLLFLPTPFQPALAVIKAIPFVKEGLIKLWNKSLTVEVLDATAISASILTGDYSTASSVMFLLQIGDTLEEWTHKKSVDDLARSYALNIDKVWKVSDKEELVNIQDIQVGDLVKVHAGHMIPLDGEIEEGEVTLNLASLTGESEAVYKKEKDIVYAGSVVEEGQCIIKVHQINGDARIDRIIQMIEDSEKLQSLSQTQAFNLADKLVPYSLGGTLLTYLLTRNITKAMSILMVDFSCALKLAMPITILSAMRECNDYHISVKGGKYLENVASADMIVFDKTGTLTYANPQVKDIVVFGDYDKLELLRLAACLEEHYPHSIANAVVRAAQEKNLIHEEQHSQVNYIVAHGIASTINDKKVILGSYHFVFEDEKTIIPNQELFNSLPSYYSHLYMAIDHQLVAVILIEDALKEDAKDVITKLKDLGMKTVMMTGDNKATAKAVADKLGIDTYYAEVYPEDKAEYIKEAQKNHTVIMIGDGMNDTPALSQADVGIAMSNGAPIAREVADITVTSDDLEELLHLKEISLLTKRRIQSHYSFIISFNLSLIILGVLGIITPSTSAFLHNTSTIAIGLNSMTKVKKNS